MLLILFYFIHVAQVWLSNVPLCPSPCLKLTILIPFSLARLLPFPHTRFKRYQEERPMCAWSDWQYSGGHPYQDFLNPHLHGSGTIHVGYSLL